MSYEYKKLDETDLQYLIDLIRLYEEAFEMLAFKVPADSYLQKLLQNTHIIFMLPFLKIM